MNRYTFDFEVQTMMTMFVNAMSDIIIKRFNANKKPESQIKVRIVYAPKQRVLNDLLNRDQNLILPVVACYIGGITRDNNRTFNKILGSFNELPDGRYLNEKQPVPIDLTINVSVMTRYQADMDQILSHLLPYINPYFVISWRTPERPDFEIRSNVYWNGTANIQYPIDINSTQVARVVADLSFVFKGWLFQAAPKDFIGSIYTIQSTYAITDEVNYAMSYEQYKLDMISSPENYDNVYLKGGPPQPTVIEPSYGTVGKSCQFNVYGKGLTRLTNVYLSGLPFAYCSTLQNPFSGIQSLSADYPGFSAVKISPSKWTTNYDNLVTVISPSASQPGKVDLILENPAGWDTLTRNVRVNSFNPFLQSPLLSTTDFIPYQLPYLSGIDFFPSNE